MLRRPSGGPDGPVPHPGPLRTDRPARGADRPAGVRPPGPHPAGLSPSPLCRRAGAARPDPNRGLGDHLHPGAVPRTGSAAPGLFFGPERGSGPHRPPPANRGPADAPRTPRTSSEKVVCGRKDSPDAAGPASCPGKRRTGGRSGWPGAGRGVFALREERSLAHPPGPSEIRRKKLKKRLVLKAGLWYCIARRNQTC